MKRTALLAIALLASVWLNAKPAQIEFVAQLTDVEASDGITLLSMQLTSAVTLTVRVTDVTEIRDENDDPLFVSDLTPGMTLKIEGVFTSEGILAEEIEVVGDESEFEIRGPIETLDAENREISIFGFVIRVPEGAEIKDEDGNPLTFSALEVGQVVKVEGTITADVLVASEVKLKTEEERPARVSFEGIVVGIDETASTLDVLIEGLETPTLVRLVPETDVKGTLAVGVLVRVIGTLEADLSTRARKVIVKRLLQLAPRELKLRVGQTRRVEVILRNPLEADVELMILSSDPAIATPLTETITIPAGKVTGFFEVTGNAEGETTLQVSTPESLGALTAVLEVEVRADRAERELEIRWTPDEVHMGTSQTRTVRLRLNQAAPTELMVALSLKEGPAGLVMFPEMVVFEPGSRGAVVAIQSGEAPGEVEIRARLPEDLGGDHDDLEVEIKSRGMEDEEEAEVEEEEEEELEIGWVPDEVETGFNQTHSVMLVLSRPAPGDLTVILTRKEGDAALLEAPVLPSELEFPEGSIQRQVEIRTGEVAGKVEIRAALPFSVGGDTDSLTVEVQEED